MTKDKYDKPVAHIAEDGRIHSLSEHLRGTSEWAAEFAKEFGCPDWAALAGLWHDLGKYSNDFQKYIFTASDTDGHIETKLGRVDHSTYGAIIANKHFGKIGRILAYIIAGHHAGLPDWQTETSGMSGLKQRLSKSEPPMVSSPPPFVLSQQLPVEKPRQSADPSMWIRMLFSCVVDADFLDTEAFMCPERSKKRGGYPHLQNLLTTFNEYMRKKMECAGDTTVNHLRADVLRQCVLKASDEPSIFSLTVPTGGGKTLSSMAFALNHAVRYSKRRIIYVIPYTSIIEQTANQFREIFGDDVVLEHHSNIAFEEKEETSKSRLASENWDAPVVVTTNVQFFESLYAARPGRCRKLHNIVNSVVILDEAQLFPPDFLIPILKVLSEIHRNYGVTLLLSTATQPPFGSGISSGDLENVKEIIEDTKSLHDKMKRVKVTFIKDLSDRISWEDLAKELCNYPTVLCVVNRRDDCRTLHTLMPEGTVHLSALMCGAHRSEVLEDIKRCLKEGIPTRVISTQLVEAGVDLDFPVVYRALSGLDSIAQSAGRCNREGRLEAGEVKVFVPPSEPPPGHLRQAAEIGRRLLNGETTDPLLPEKFTEFFKEFYWLRGERLDTHGILKDLGRDSELRFSFRTAAGKFRIIDESQYTTVIVRYGEGAELINTLIKRGPERWLMRKLQRYVVNIPRYLSNELIKSGVIEEPSPGIYIQSVSAFYDHALGFIYRAETIRPDDLIV